MHFCGCDGLDICHVIHEDMLIRIVPPGRISTIRSLLRSASLAPPISVRTLDLDSITLTEGHRAVDPGMQAYGLQNESIHRNPTTHDEGPKYKRAEIRRIYAKENTVRVQAISNMSRKLETRARPHDSRIGRSVEVSPVSCDAVTRESRFKSRTVGRQRGCHIQHSQRPRVMGDSDPLAIRQFTPLGVI